ncbi:hypothetical protein [Bradyrhizobium cenepequi]
MIIIAPFVGLFDLGKLEHTKSLTTSTIGLDEDAVLIPRMVPSRTSSPASAKPPTARRHSLAEAKSDALSPSPVAQWLRQ